MVVPFIIFLNSANLICRGTDISKYFRESLGLRENESQLYFVWNPLYCLLSNSHSEWQTVQIQISWLLQKPTDLDLHCLQRQGISGFSMTGVKVLSKVAAECSHKLILLFSEKIRLHFLWIFCKVDILFSVKIKEKKKCFKILSTVVVINT